MREEIISYWIGKRACPPGVHLSILWTVQRWKRKIGTSGKSLFFHMIRLYFYSVDMRSKYNMVKTGRVKYSWSKWEDERLPGLRGLKRAPSLAGVERRTSGPHRRARQVTYLDVSIYRIEIDFLFQKMKMSYFFEVSSWTRRSTWSYGQSACENFKVHVFNWL
jgi:hypothetical protein